MIKNQIPEERDYSLEVVFRCRVSSTQTLSFCRFTCAAHLPRPRHCQTVDTRMPRPL